MTDVATMMRCHACGIEFPAEDQVYMGSSGTIGSGLPPEPNAGGYCSEECGDDHIDLCLYRREDDMFSYGMPYDGMDWREEGVEVAQRRRWKPRARLDDVQSSSETEPVLDMADPPTTDLERDLRRLLSPYEFNADVCGDRMVIKLSLNELVEIVGDDERRKKR